MAHLRPFAALRYARNLGLDYSNLIAPPYDVISNPMKGELQALSEYNIVGVDLPHLPAKSVGPDSAYAAAATTFKHWIADGVMEKDRRAALYPYTQTFDHHGRTFHRRGFIALVRLSPFGQGQVVPHEQTYPDAIVDRLNLTRATGVQLSPVFGLYSDTRHEVAKLLYANLGKPEISATHGGVKNDVWSVTDSDVENKVIDYLGTHPVYIADGHHRYTMALRYMVEQADAHGGKLPPAHPANFCMFVLVGMQDDGLLILPTHRLIGGLQNFDVEAFALAISSKFDVTALQIPPAKVREYVDVQLPKSPAHTFGLYDGRAKKLYELSCKDQDVLKPFEPKHSDAWRRLDVAILQRYLLDEIIGPKFAGGAANVKKGYTADAAEIVSSVDGGTHQIALLLKSTPLGALEQLGQHNEVMPPKSTYFYPKLATGLLMAPLTCD